MGIPYNETQLISSSLTLLGYPSIQSIPSGGPSAQALHELYDMVLAADLSSPNWRFATKTQVLSQIAGLDPNFIWYNTAYQIPADCLAIWQIWPGVPYEVFGEQIWTTGTQELTMQYRHAGPLSLYPPAYIMYFSYLMACTIAPGVTDDPKVITLLQADMAKWRSQAMVVNSQGRPNKGLTNSRWSGARNAGAGYMSGNNSGGW